MALLLSGCTSNDPGSDVNSDLLADAPWQNSTIEPGWSLWLNYNVYNTTTFPFEWVVKDERPVQFTVYRTKSTGEDVLYTVTAARDEGEVVARHPNLHSLVWRNINDENVTLQVRVREGYSGDRYGPGEDPAKTNCPTLCMADSRLSPAIGTDVVERR